MDFGDFANIDVEKLLRGTQEQFARLEELQRRTGTLTGSASDGNRLVTAEYTQAGLYDLRLDPRAMRLPSGELAELIKQVIAAAAEDLREKAVALMTEVFGDQDNPMKLLEDPQAALAKVKEAEAVYDRTFDEVMAHLDTIRRRLDL
ncbi:YbaB/EbfC family nucleoid-associated protein [Sphaerisporangium aureirubrum]|uniref:YbaB/EbfC family nucleoid-associated protein n=1 Tax=Sphaerisporangium aureirubrum TaxID=1544736 RepID=A0ABW1NV24_9ACTN